MQKFTRRHVIIGAASIPFAGVSGGLSAAASDVTAPLIQVAASRAPDFAAQMASYFLSRHSLPKACFLTDPKNFLAEAEKGGDPVEFLMQQVYAMSFPYTGNGPGMSIVDEGLSEAPLLKDLTFGDLMSDEFKAAIEPHCEEAPELRDYIASIVKSMTHMGANPKDSLAGFIEAQLKPLLAESKDAFLASMNTRPVRVLRRAGVEARRPALDPRSGLFSGVLSFGS